VFQQQQNILQQCLSVPGATVRWTHQTYTQILCALRESRSYKITYCSSNRDFPGILVTKPFKKASFLLPLIKTKC